MMAKLRSEGTRYPIRAVARLTGLSVDTLRAWERRYEAVVPGRTNRGRQYSEADVARLRQLAELVERGHPIGTIASASTAQLERLLTGPAPRAADGAETAARLDDLYRALDGYDLEQIESVLNRYAAVLPPRELIFSVMVPLLREIGERWEAGQLRPSQEHLVSAIVRSVLGGLLRASSRPMAGPTVIFATPSGERHELGLLCAAVLAASAGYGAIYLGPDVPADDIVHAAATTGARCIIMSATAPGALPKGEARRLSSLPDDVDVWVGGPNAPTVIAAVGDRARRLDTLDDVLPILSRYGR
jgi:DNA-binding transcriptional MerR regulator